jgi:N-acetylmuramoyl-L-alanine amidase
LKVKYRFFKYITLLAVLGLFCAGPLVSLSLAASKSVAGGHAVSQQGSKTHTPAVQGGHSAVASDARTAYAQAKKHYDSLNNDSKLRKNKAAWEDVIAQFRKVYLTFPEDAETAPKSLWMLGRCYEEMYGWTGQKSLLDEAVTRYSTLTEKFPGNLLADDALMAVARIYVLKDDKGGAIDIWRRVVIEYPDGDMVNRAKEQLKAHSVSLDTLQTGGARAKNAPPLVSGGVQGSGEKAVTPANVADRIPSDGPATDAASTGVAQPASGVAGSTNGIKEVEDVRYWSVSDYTRVVIAASGPVSFKEGWLPGDDGKGLPRRFYLDISPAHKSKKLKDLTVKTGFLKGVRIGQFDSKTVRVVCDLGSSNDVKAFYLEDPFRVIIDAFGDSYKTPRPCVIPAAKEKAAEARSLDRLPAPKMETAQQPMVSREEGPEKHAKEVREDVIPQKGHVPEPHEEQLAARNQKMAMLKGKPSLARQLGLCVRRIVVDPGHGGKDPGAIGPSGLKEKDVTLKLAKKVAARLREELGAEVILTRDRDVFVPLEQRTAIANAQKADLFVSIHTNAAPSSRLRGIETYYLNFAVDEHAMRVAALENASSSRRMGDLSGILNQILKNTKVDESSRLARAVQDALTQSIRGNGGKDLGVKQAPFFVLIGAKMPSVLVETSFISNDEEEKMLKDNGYLDQLSSGIVSGLRHYMKDMGMNAGGG